MGHDDRYGDRDRGNMRGRDDDRHQGDWNRERGGGGGDDRGFFDRAGESVRSWFGGDDDHDQNRGGGRGGGESYSSGDRHQGGDRYQSGDRFQGGDRYRGGDNYQGGRMSSQGGYQGRGDQQGRSERYSQGQNSGGGRDDDRRFSDSGHGGSQSSFSGSGGVNQTMGSYGGNRGGGYSGGGDSAGDLTGSGIAGPGYDPNFSGGPRFDRQDVGSTGTHGAHPVASPYGEAQTSIGGGGGFGAGGSSARARAILDQHARQHGHDQQRGQQPQSQQSYGQSQMGGQQSAQGRGGHHDPHYQEWRRRQIESLDRDYDEYRRENSSRFESEFGSWRDKRGQQRQHMGRVTEKMEVVGSDGQHVGTVDKMAGDRIILTKSDPNAGGHHHSIPCSWLETVDDKVTLNKTADEAMQAWRDEETSRALFERPDSGSDGPHILDRSFSGTYREDER